MPATVSFDEAQIGFASRRLLAGVSFRLEAGQRGVLTGPNGAGKSTLLRSLMDSQLVLGGKIEVGCPRKKVSWLSQWPRLDWSVPCSVEEFLLASRLVSFPLWSRLQSRDKKRIQELLEKFDFAHKKKEPVANLSGGEIQRLMLCRALAIESEVLLLDEPFSALDVESKPKFMSILDEIRGQTTQLLVLHDRRDIERVQPDLKLEVKSHVVLVV